MKELTLKFILFFGCCLSFLNTMAYDFEDNGIGYEITSFTNLTVTASEITNKSMKEVVIPQIVTFKDKGLKVTKIAPSFAANNDSIESVKVESSVDTIGSKAFYNCSKLTDLSLMPTIKVIQDQAFQDCKELQTVVLPDSVTTLGKYAFYNCSNLKNIDLKNIKRIEEYTFANCSSLSHIDLNRVDYIGANAFSSTAFETIEIPNNILDLGKDAFSNCKSLKSVVIGNGITHLSFCFTGCDNLINLRIEDGELGITFDKYQKPAALLGTYNYYGYFCSLPLKDVYVGRIMNGYSPFYGSKTLESVQLGTSVAQLPDFSYTYYKNGIIYTAYHGTFEDCENLKSVILSPNISSIPDKCFYNCKFLNDISLPQTLCDIPSSTFYGCSNLKDVTIGYHTLSINSNAFEGCENIQKLAFYNPNPPTFNGTFGNSIYMNATLLVPQNATENYRTKSPWSSFWNIEEDADLLSTFTIDGVEYEIIEENNVRITNAIFYELTDLTIPNTIVYQNRKFNIVEIASSAFQGNTKLQSIAFTNPKIKIPEYAFKDCINLKEIALPEELTEITNGVFTNCISLSEIVLPNGISKIGEEAFKGCSTLKNFTIPGSCLSIGNNTFTGTSLASLTLDESEQPITFGYSGDLVLSSEITPFPNPSNVDERRTGFRNCYYNGLFYGLPIERLIINRDVDLSKYYERVKGNSTSNYSTVYNDIIYYSPFYGLSKLKYVEIGEKVSNICKNQIEAVVNAKPSILNYNAFGGCGNIEVVISNNPNAPVGGGFSQSVYETAHLFLPNGGENSYTTDDYWKNFSQIEAAAFVPIEAISFEEDNITMDTNESIVLHPIIYPENASIKQLKWSCSDRYYAEVSEDGVVTSKNRDATITITAAACDASGISSSIEVTIYEGASIRDVSNDSNVRIFTKDGKIHISGKSDSDIVKIYNPQGQLVQTSKKSVIDLNTDGCFIVRIGSVSKKIIL
ncbi:MAG: leucine-rich repeat domain-containing protein [Bacteroides sp.]|nr:leucine-rich repeat domain-containing protein [Bacteroides sp.]